MINLSPKIIDRLKSNWGDRMHAMACYAEARIMEPRNRWAVYLLAMNPQDEDEIFMLTDQWKAEMPEIGSLQALGETFNDEGEYPLIDCEYRPVWASELFKRLGGNL
jgi:hypothetical protein